MNEILEGIKALFAEGTAGAIEVLLKFISVFLCLAMIVIIPSKKPFGIGKIISWIVLLLIIYFLIK